MANGPDLYQAVLTNPQAFPKDLEFEALLSIGPTAHERRTGRELDHVTPYSYETFSNLDGWPESDTTDAR